MTRRHAIRPTVLAIVAVAVGLALAGVMWLTLRSDDMRRAAWRDAIVSASTEELPPLLRQLDEHPEIAVPLLVELLGSERPEIAIAAAGALHEQVDLWRSLPGEQSAGWIAMLSAELALRADRLPPRGQQVAASLAKEMLLWPLNNSAAEAGNILANCELILRTTNSLESIRVANTNIIASKTPLPTALQTPPLPGGGLTVTPQQVPPLPEVAVESVARHPAPPAEIYSPLAIPLHLADRLPPPGETPSQNLEITQPQSSAEEPVGLEAIDQVLSELDDVEVARLLHAAEPLIADAAEQELRARGFQDREIELARALRHPDPRTRKALARALPQIPGINPQYWLYALAEDEDAGVRRTAITILASSDAAAVTRWLLERRERESEPTVAKRIDELLKSRR